jgi:hypothetical protein
VTDLLLAVLGISLAMLIGERLNLFDKGIAHTAAAKVTAPVSFIGLTAIHGSTLMKMVFPSHVGIASVTAIVVGLVSAYVGQHIPISNGTKWAVTIIGIAPFVTGLVVVAQTYLI